MNPWFLASISLQLATLAHLSDLQLGVAKLLADGITANGRTQRKHRRGGVVRRQWTRPGKKFDCFPGTFSAWAPLIFLQFTYMATLVNFIWVSTSLDTYLLVITSELQARACNSEAVTYLLCYF